MLWYKWFLPHTCILCHFPTHSDYDICQFCLKELPILPQSCPRCANTLLTDKNICGPCISNPPPFEMTHALYHYLKPITNVMMGIKFHQQLVHAKVLGDILANQIKQGWYVNKSLPDLIIPTPLHPLRLRERGFNQALEIAKPASKLLKIPIDAKSCTRTKNTLAQATLIKEKRLQNMKNAFFCHRNLAGMHVAVVDDVITTGQTMAELCRTLKTAGARQIDVWCCAKTPLKIHFATAH